MRATLKNPVAIRLSLFYASVFTMIGLHIAFWPVWLKSKGLDASQIGLVLAFSLGIKVIVNPLLAHLADRSGERKRLIIVLSVGALISFSGFFWADGLTAILAVSVSLFVFWSPIMPVHESLTIFTTHKLNLNYGAIRLWGSISFIAAVVVGGMILTGKPEIWIFTLILAAIVMTSISAFLLPDYHTPKAEAGNLPLKQVLSDKNFILFLIAAALLQASHSVYYAFATLQWRGLGFSESLIGALWAEGVIAEIILFAASGFFIKKFGAARLMAMAGLAGTIRWSIAAVTDDLAIIVFLQLLHAFTFGAAHLGAMHFIQNRIDPKLSATTQSIYSAAAMGLGVGSGVYLAGILYHGYGTAAYFAMTVFSVLGGLLAFTLRRPRTET